MSRDSCQALGICWQKDWLQLELTTYTSYKMLIPAVLRQLLNATTLLVSAHLDRLSLVHAAVNTLLEYLSARENSLPRHCPC